MILFTFIFILSPLLPFWVFMIFFAAMFAFGWQALSGTDYIDKFLCKALHTFEEYDDIK